MRWIIALCLLCLALPFAWHSGRAHSNDCDTAQTVSVHIHQVPGNPVFDFSQDVPAIQSMANESVHQVRAGWALGLTRYKLLLEMDAPMSVTKTKDGLFCARPKSVDINVGTKDMNIFLPSELSGDRCGFEQILRHEDEHIAVSGQILKKYAVLIQEKLDAYVKSNGGVREKTSEAAVALQQNMLRISIADIAGQMEEETNTRQHEVDSPLEYQRLLNICDGELADLVKDTRNHQLLAQGF